MQPSAAQPTIHPGVWKPGLVFIIAAVMLGLYALDSLLERLEQTELAAEAQRTHTRGMQLLASQRPLEAVEQLKRSYALDRKNIGYEVDLADAEVAAGKQQEALAALADILQRDSNNGKGNLLMARLTATNGRADEADAYYHRAIYGSWPPDNAAATRLAARMELINFLAHEHKRDELLAELLGVEVDAEKDPALTEKIAGLFIQAGSPARAIAAYRRVLANDPANTHLYEELGQAQLAEGDFHGAAATYVTGVRHRHDPELLKKIAFTNELIALDPTPRRLGSAEKMKRSNELLTLAEQAFRACEQLPPADAELLLTSADQMLAAKTPPTNEAAEARISLAQQLWKARPQSCTAAMDPRLPYVMAKLAT